MPGGWKNLIWIPRRVCVNFHTFFMHQLDGPRRQQINWKPKTFVIGNDYIDYFFEGWRCRGKVVKGCLTQRTVLLRCPRHFVSMGYSNTVTNNYYASRYIPLYNYNIAIQDLKRKLGMLIELISLYSETLTSIFPSFGGERWAGCLTEIPKEAGRWICWPNLSQDPAGSIDG